MRRVRPEFIAVVSAVLISNILGIAIGVSATHKTVASKEATSEKGQNIQFCVVVNDACKPIEEISEEAEAEVTDHSVGMCEITAYCTCVECCGIWSQDHPSRQGTDYVQLTKSGTVPTEGRTVAVDPDVIPLGSAVFINGVCYIAEDTGSAIKGNVVDIYFDDHNEAKQFGRQTAMVTYVK